MIKVFFKIIVYLLVFFISLNVSAEIYICSENLWDITKEYNKTTVFVSTYEELSNAVKNAKNREDLNKGMR